MQTAERTDLDRLAVDTVRVLAMDAIQKAGSGHPGTAMALAPAAYVLWTRFLRFDPADPKWFDRDRFVLSNGHASVLQYAVLHLTGYPAEHQGPQAAAHVGFPDAWPPGVRAHPWSGGDHRPVGPGGWQRGRVGDRRAAAGRPLQPARPRAGRPSHLGVLWRRRHDGGRGQRGVVAGRAPAAGQADGAVRRQPDHHRRADLASPSPRTWPSGTRPTAGTCSQVEDANDLEAIAAAYQAAVEEPERPDLHPAAHSYRLGGAQRPGHLQGARRRPGRGRGPGHQAGLRLEPGQALQGARGGVRALARPGRRGPAGPGGVGAAAGRLRPGRAGAGRRAAGRAGR